MDSQDDERLDEAQLEHLSTPELIRHAFEEARLLARAEVLVAREELRAELAAAGAAVALVGVALALALSGLGVLFVALALVVPLSEPLAALIVGVALLLLAAGIGYAGYKSLPKKPLPRTRERLKKDVALTREQLQ